MVADKGQFRKIPTYRVAPGKVMAADPRPTQTVEAVEEQNLDILVTNGAPAVNGCNVVMTDIKALSGVIHVLECVLIPPAA